MRWQRPALLAVAAMAIGTWLLQPEEQLPPSLADGTYINTCCDPLVLRGGLGRVEDRSFSYVIESDKVGRYVRPTDRMIWAEARGFVLVPADSGSKLRLQDSDPPAWIDVIGSDDRYHFQRRANS